MRNKIFLSSADRRDICLSESPKVVEFFRPLERASEYVVNAGYLGARRFVVDDETRREQHEQTVRPHDHDGQIPANYSHGTARGFVTDPEPSRRCSGHDCGQETQGARGSGTPTRHRRKLIEK